MTSRLSREVNPVKATQAVGGVPYTWDGSGVGQDLGPQKGPSSTAKIQAEQRAVIADQKAIATMKATGIFSKHYTDEHEKEMLQAIELLKRVEQSTLDTISEIEEDLEDEEEDDE